MLLFKWIFVGNQNCTSTRFWPISVAVISRNTVNNSWVFVHTSLQWHLYRRRPNTAASHSLPPPHCSCSPGSSFRHVSADTAPPWPPRMETALARRSSACLQTSPEAPGARLRPAPWPCPDVGLDPPRRSFLPALGSLDAPYGLVPSPGQMENQFSGRCGGEFWQRTCKGSSLTHLLTGKFWPSCLLWFEDSGRSFMTSPGFERCFSDDVSLSFHHFVFLSHSAYSFCCKMLVSNTLQRSFQIQIKGVDDVTQCSNLPHWGIWPMKNFRSSVARKWRVKRALDTHTYKHLQGTCRTWTVFLLMSEINFGECFFFLWQKLVSLKK